MKTMTGSNVPERTGIHRKALVTALTAVTVAASSAAIAAPAATDRGLNDYRHPKLNSPEVPSGMTHITAMQDDHWNMSLPALPVVKRWQVGSREEIGPFTKPGWLSPFATTVHPDGVHYWAVSAEGDGFSHIHVIDRFTGQVVFETDPWIEDDPFSPDSGPGPIAVNYILADIDGNVYLPTPTELWSWDQDFNLRYRVPNPVAPNADGVPTQIVGTPIGTPLFVGEDLVGGATYDGFWLFFNRHTGAVEIAEPMVNPTPQPIPCGAGLQAIAIAAAIRTPEIAPSAAVTLTCASFGRGVTVSESNSLDPTTDFIYEYVGQVGTEDRFVVQYAVVPDPANPGKQTVVTRNVSDGQPPGGATTPTISLSTNTVVVADGAGAFKAFSLDDMSLVWETPPGNEAALSPGLDQFGNLIAADRKSLYKFDANSGDTLWIRNYDELAVGVLPELRPFPPLVPDGAPKSLLTSVQITSPSEYQTTITFGYQIENAGVFLPQGAVEWPIPSGLTGYALTDPETGDNQGVSVINYDGAAIDTGQIVSIDGWVVGQLTDVFALIGSLTLDPLLPPRYKFPGPKFGAYGVETASHLANSQKRLDECLAFNKEASQNLKKDTQRAFDVARRCVPHLGPKEIQQEVIWAARDNEISVEQAAAVNASLQLAHASQTAAKDGLLAEFYSEKAVRSALHASDQSMKVALKALQGKGGGKK